MCTRPPTKPAKRRARGQARPPRPPAREGLRRDSSASGQDVQSEPVREEGELVEPQRDGPGDGAAGMADVLLPPYQDRPVIGPCRARVLQGRRELARVQRVDPGVALEDREQRRGIAPRLFGVVVGRVSEQPLELLGTVAEPYSTFQLAPRPNSS